MFLGVLTPGTRVNWSIGKQGETPDIYPARVYQARGRQVSLIVLRKNLAGEEFLDHVRTSDLFVDSRTGEILEDLDTPTMAELAQSVIEAKNERAAQAASAAEV